ncbi:response regulator [Oscillatoria sp. FACHB-1407]|uniref:response regulator n=1 Tax=Oscillatoria sp. FACHB-1407 TaxID=2692847 RepID=UPI001682A36C|nr:response regulator [Oscillatoria sp. FACHB-1407]MBD2460194.1 response regulator [Oscillatoria sp. FACHB-1407]
MYKVAVVDDDENWCLSIQRFLKQEFDITIFTTVSELLDHHQTYDLVLIDFTILPSSEYETVMNGCELIHHLKTTRQPPPLAILVSGFISRRDLGEGMQLCPNADAFLAKDAGLETTLQLVKRLLLSQ